jgi:hypothetical protein
MNMHRYFIICNALVFSTSISTLICIGIENFPGLFDKQITITGRLDKAHMVLLVGSCLLLTIVSGFVIVKKVFSLL